MTQPDLAPRPDGCRQHLPAGQRCGRDDGLREVPATDQAIRAAATGRPGK